MDGERTDYQDRPEIGNDACPADGGHERSTEASAPTHARDPTKPGRGRPLRPESNRTDYTNEPDPNDERLCLAELRQSGHFGELSEYISLDYMTVTVNVQGTLDYQWTGSDGVTASKSSPFSVVLPIASVANDAECGEGGEIIPVNHDPFMLKLDESGYKIAIPFAGDVDRSGRSCVR